MTTESKNPSKSGNPAKRASAKKTTAKKATKKTAAPQAVASAKDFKKHKKGRPVELPSGLVVMARRVGIEDFVLKAKAGSVPNPLMDIVSEALEKGNQVDPTKIAGVEEDKIDIETINEMMRMVDSVIIESVKEPKVYSDVDAEGELIPEEDRDEELLYVDEFDAEDKMFLFYWNTGGVEDVASFREEARAGMAALATGQGGEVPTK